MCGIVAVIIKQSNGFTKKQEDVFYQMLYADVLRGEDSTGIIAVENNKDFHIAKEAAEATWVIPQIRKSHIEKAMFQRGAALIGHNRKATSGGVTDETAHPFVVDKTFAMVHNGTLYGHRELANTEVDSQALAIVLKGAFGAEKRKEALEETLGKVHGAYALIAYDQITDEVHILRNKERPLAYIETEDCWIFGSEALMIKWIAQRNGYDTTKHQLKPVLEHDLITISLSDNKETHVSLTPKKAIPSTKAKENVTHTIGAGEKTTGNKEEDPVVEGGVLSKNQFKRIRKKYLYTRQEFWALDYIEKNYPRTILDGEKDILVLGESDDINYECTMSTQINLDDLGIAADAAEAYFNEHRWVGLVHSIDFNKETGGMTFHLTKAKPIVSYPKKVTHEIANTLH